LQPNPPRRAAKSLKGGNLGISPLRLSLLLRRHLGAGMVVCFGQRLKDRSIARRVRSNAIRGVLGIRITNRLCALRPCSRQQHRPNPFGFGLLGLAGSSFDFTDLRPKQSAEQPTVPQTSSRERRSAPFALPAHGELLTDYCTYGKPVDKMTPFGYTVRTLNNELFES
jgi:hypothetical protein